MNWPTGIIGVVSYFFLFFKVKLYADMCLQVVFMIQGITGWVSWSRDKSQKDKVTVSALDTQGRIICFIFIVFSSLLWWRMLVKYTDASNPLVDAFVSILSLTANWLLVKRKVENWVLWILADIIYTVLFFYKGLHLSSVLYMAFLILAILGFKKWNQTKDIKKALF
jgi:nicotinamide mononucleotide transporter